MERLSGSAYCPNCKSQFDWVDTLLERGEVITTFKTELHKNISSTERLITGNGLREMRMRKSKKIMYNKLRKKE